MFHLWIPNGVNLTGNYDWFYEGFALYQSLKMGVAVEPDTGLTIIWIRFRGPTGSITGRKTLSLIDASKNRWNGNNNTQIYARGMLVAFLCDLAMLEASKGKRSVYRSVARGLSNVTEDQLPKWTETTQFSSCLDRTASSRRSLTGYIIGAEHRRMELNC